MHLRLLAAILSFAILAASILGVFWIWKQEIRPEREVRAQLAQPSLAPPPDPGIRVFEKATVLMQNGEIDAARTDLLKLVRGYPDSSRFAESKRIIGEINVDSILSAREMPGKQSYIVQSGDSLALIAQRNKCTIDYIVQSSGLLGKIIHPGDRVTVFPLDFSLVVDLGGKTATLMRKDRFFKEYEIESIKLPAGLRLPMETTVKSKSAWVDGRSVLTADKRYSRAEKWVLTARAGLRLMPSKAPEETGTGLVEEQEPGIFLRAEDVEELYCLLRTRSPVKVIR